ncbi:MAG: YceI family protein [Myxococcaceae bacterium]
MKRILISSALAAGLIAAPAFAEGPASKPVSSRVWLKGDSSVRSFRCDAKSVDTRLPGLAQAGSVEALSRAEVTGEVKILVFTLDCANRTMNDHLQNALKMREHPQIALKVNSVKLGERKGDAVNVIAKADLTISGQTRSIVLNAVANETPSGLVLSGEHKLKMTDYGVQPPSLMLGTMKVKDDVTVGFELSVAAPAEKPTAVGQL